MNAGWIVFDLGGRPRAAGPTSEAAVATAQALGAMPLRSRVASATAEELDALELPAALGLEADDTPHCRAPDLG